MKTRAIGAWPVVALGALLVTACGLHDRPKVERKVPGGGIQAEGAQVAVDAQTVVAPGIVEPWGEQVDVAGKESGWLAEIRCNEGDVVVKDQVLALLDDSLQVQAVKLAEAGVNEAKADLLKLQRGATPEELKQAEAEFDAAVARGSLATTSQERTARLHAGGAVSETAADQADAEARVQDALKARAEARLGELKRGARSEDRFAARARLEAAQVRVESAKVALERRKITAPQAGTILVSNYRPGEFFDAAKGPLVSMGDLTRLQLRLEVDEIDVPTVALGAPCDIVSDSGKRLGTGSVVRLAPRMGRRVLQQETPTDRADVRVREVYIEFAPGPDFIAGQRLWGHIRTAERKVTEVMQRAEGQ